MARPIESLSQRIHKITFDLEKIKKLYLAGWTDKQVVDLLGITIPALGKWKKLEKFSYILKDWKVTADSVIERSLYERAKGYEHPEDKVFCEGGKVTIVPTIKHYPPDSTACIFWLKNRQPDKWRDKTDMDLGLKENLVDALKNIPVAELLSKVNAIIGKSPAK